MEPAPELPVAPAPVPDEPRPWAWRPRLSWIALALELGLLVGFTLQSMTANPEEQAAPAAEPAEAPPDVNKAEKAAPKGFADLDEMIRAGAYRAALRVCEDLTRDGRPDEGLRHRRGLCLEGLGRWRDALEVVQPLADRPTPTVITAAARLAVARCAIRLGRLAQARSALEPFFATRVAPEFASPRVIGEACYLAALLASASLPTTVPPGPQDNSGPATIPFPFAPDYALDLMTARPDRPHRPPPDRPAIPPHVGHSDYDSVTTAWSRALEAAPDHPLGPYARLERANLEFRQGRFREALAGYELVLAAAPRSAEARAATYNQGIVRFRQGALQAARQAFLQVIDQGQADRWTALAWWWTGRSYLDASEPRLALRPFRRAVTIGAGTDVVGPAVLATAAAHLLDDKAARANATLRTSRGRLTADSHRAFAALLDTLACSSTGPRDPSQPNANDLLDAALGVGTGSPIGPAGTYWLGMAYRRCGLDAAAVKLYEQSLPSCRGTLAVRMTVTVADHHFQNGRAGEARSRYQSVAALDRGSLGALAAQRLAELALRAGRTDECLAYCQAALGYPGAARDAILRTMGQAHERAGNLAQAIRCYAGMAPGR